MLTQDIAIDYLDATRPTLPSGRVIQAMSQATREAIAPIPGVGTEDLIHLRLDEGSPDRFRISFVSPNGQLRRVTRCDRKLLARLPERKSGRDRNHPYPNDEWAIAATDYTCTVLASAWPIKNILLDAEAEIVFHYLLETLARQNRVAEVSARFKEGEGLPNFGLAVHPEYPLAAYQTVGAANAIYSEGYALFMEQGTGKTPTAIAAVCNSINGSLPYRVAVVCPSNVRMNWENEIAKFTTRIGRTTVLRGTALNRMDQLLDAMRCDPDDEFTAVIMSYDVLCESWRVLSMIEWDLAILDESHYIKTPTTRRFKYALKLRDRSKKRLVLTGTPITNTPLDLYAQMEFLAKGGSGFMSWKNFRSFYGVYDRTEQGFERLLGVKNMPMLQERLARTAFIIRKTEALPHLPEKVYTIEECDMSPRQTEVYNEVATNLATEVAAMVEGDYPKQLLVSNILTKLLRLAQITAGFIQWDAVVTETGEVLRPAITEHFDPSPKVEWLVERLKNREPNKKTILWSCWVPVILAVADRLRDEGFKTVTFYGDTNDAGRVEAERAFNYDPETTVFVGSQAAGGTGLNLLGYPPGREEYETNCDEVIYYAQNWSPVHRSQSEDRAHRRGTRGPVTIVDLCVPGTIDEEIRARVTKKITTALEISDIRSILRAVISKEVAI